VTRDLRRELKCDVEKEMLGWGHSRWWFWWVGNWKKHPKKKEKKSEGGKTFTTSGKGPYRRAMEKKKINFPKHKTKKKKGRRRTRGFGRWGNQWSNKASSLEREKKRERSCLPMTVGGKKSWLARCMM